MIQKLWQQSKQLVTRYCSTRRLSARQTKWERRWSGAAFDPAWRITEIPPELQEAVTQQWFPPASHLLDIGCGKGECAGWLSQQEYQVLGIDFAPSAIKRARVAYPENDRLQFCVLDICQATPNRRFQALFDRGCLHTIPAAKRPAYVRQVAAAARPGAHFLLLHKTHGHPDQPTVLPAEQAVRNEQTLDQIKRDFQATVEIIKIQPILIPRAAGLYPKPPVPALAIWLVRRELY